MTLREGEERGICSAALKELLKIIKDHIGDRSVVVLVLNKASAIWKDSIKYESIVTKRSVVTHRR